MVRIIVARIAGLSAGVESWSEFRQWRGTASAHSSRRAGGARGRAFYTISIIWVIARRTGLHTLAV